MSTISYIFRFLRDLRNNNDKEWLHNHRDRYEQARAHWREQVEEICNTLSDYDTVFGTVDPKNTIGRINNNLLYHPDKPTYKDYFDCEPLKNKDGASFYIHIGPGNSFIAGGFYRPDNEKLNRIRKAIDEDGDSLRELLDDKEFKQFHGELDRKDDKLKTSPRGYPNDHEHIDLLNYKSFTVAHDITNEEAESDALVSIVAKGYKIIQPGNDFLSKAMKA